MEKYIVKINNKILRKNDIEKAKKIKKKFRIVGGVILAVGIAGFLAMFITFMVLFFKMHTEKAFSAWLIAIPFLILTVAGSVLARVGDAMDVSEEKKAEVLAAYEDRKKEKEEKKTEKQEKKQEKKDKKNENAKKEQE